MTTTSPDCELIADYAARGSEAAFRALVARHVGLVYATAMRQLGDPGLAEETTQNVFIALARKSPRLMGVQTIAGWLHRCTLLEAKARLRTELRRRRREAAAAELAVPQSDEESPLSVLVPFVDEALLNLREHDRLALVLRFFEDRSLRDIGQVLGVDEDAARKRVSRALDRVTEFFRKRGFATTSVAGAALLASASEAAPAGLAVTAANAGLAGGGFGGIGVVILQLMALTKTQTIIICAALIAAPLAYQSQSAARLTRSQQLIDSQLAEARRRGDTLQAEIEQARQTSLRSQADILAAQTQLQSLTNKLNARAPLTPYQWNDNSPLARVPKQFAQSLSIYPAKDNRGELNDTIKEVLQLSGPETLQVQDALDRFLKECHAEQARNLRSIAPSEVDANGHPPEEIRAFSIPAVGDRYGELKQTLFTELTDSVGSERFSILKNALGQMIPLEDSDTSNISSATAVFNGNHREAFYKPKPGDLFLGWEVVNEHSRMITGIRPEEIPDYLRPQLQDWINIMQSPATGGQQ